MSQEKEPRRRFLRQMFAIVPASGLATGVALTQTACSKPPQTGSANELGATSLGLYEPTYFTKEEYTFIEAAVDHLIPSDKFGAGALECDVPVFIDRQMETPYGHGKLWYMQGPFHPDESPDMGYQMNLNPRQIYRHGIAETNGYCVKHHDKAFADLSTDLQVEVLKALDAGAPQFESLPSRTFFSYLLANTKEAYLADPIYGGNKNMGGWKMIGFPGARADFIDWIDKPNVNYPYGPVSISGMRG